MTAPGIRLQPTGDDFVAAPFLQEDPGWSPGLPPDLETGGVNTVFLDDGSAVTAAPPEEVFWLPPKPAAHRPPLMPWAAPDELAIPPEPPGVGGGFAPGLTTIRLQPTGDDFVPFSGAADWDFNVEGAQAWDLGAVFGGNAWSLTEAAGTQGFILDEIYGSNDGDDN